MFDGRCLLGLLGLLALPSDDSEDSSESVSCGGVQYPVPVRESDSVLVVPLRGDRYNRCVQGLMFNGAMPFSPLLWRLAMPSGPFLPQTPFSLSRMGHYGQTQTPKTGTAQRTKHSPICFRNILVESLAESVSHECPLMSSLSRGQKWDT